MKKSELKTGMVVTLRDGTKAMVIKGICTRHTDEVQHFDDVIVGIDNDNQLMWEPLDHYRENLCVNDDEFDWMDIMKVEMVKHPYDLIRPFDTRKIEKTLFNREPNENEQFLSWLEAEYEKYPMIAQNKIKTLNEFIYVIRMSDRDYCINIINSEGGCTCIPSAKETFIPSAILASEIKSIKYDTEDAEHPVVVIELM